MDLKQKLFSAGISGLKTKEFSEDQIQFISLQKWAEIITKEEHDKFETGLKNFKIYQVKTLNESITNVKIISEKSYVVKLNIEEWQMMFSSIFFKFKSIGFLIVLNFLIQDKTEYKALDDLHKIYSIPPETTKYIIKKLKKHGIVEKNEFSSIRLKKFKNGFYFNDIIQITETEKNLEKQEKQVDCVFYENTPLIKLISDEIRLNKKGVTSKRVEKMFGLQKKQSFGILKKIYEMNKSNISKIETSSGKVKRNVFFDNKMLNKTPLSNRYDYFTTNKVSALEELIFHRKAFILDNEIKNLLKEITGSTVVPERRTILRLAQRENYKIFRTINNHYIIADKNMKEDDQLILNLKNDKIKKQEKAETNIFQEFLYEKFVNNHKFILLDNKFLYSDKKVITRFLELYILKNDTNQKNFYRRFIDNLTIKEFFEIFPIKRINAFKSVTEALGGEDVEIREVHKMKNKPECIRFFCIRANSLQNNITMNRLKKLGILKQKKEEIFVLSGKKINLEAVDDKSFPYIERGKRIEMYEKIKNYNIDNYMPNCEYLIKRSYKGNDREGFLYILNNLKKKEKKEKIEHFNELPSFLRKKYVQIKESIFENKNLENIEGDGKEIDSILKYMLKKNIIRKIKDDEFQICFNTTNVFLGNKKFESCIPNVTLDLKTEKKVSEYFLFICKVVYYTLLKTGSLEVTEIQEKLKIFETFEIIEVVTFFEKFFTTFNNKGFYIISLKNLF